MHLRRGALRCGGFGRLSERTREFVSWNEYENACASHEDCVMIMMSTMSNARPPVMHLAKTRLLSP